jgi:hypothetical protein
MIVPFIILALLVALVPAFETLDGVWTIGAASAILAAALMIIAVALPAMNLFRFSRLLRPILVVVLAAPVLWMLVQVIPLPAHALANPIWASASGALNQRFSGVISIDIGATLLSLVRYCAVLAAALVTTAVALDRQRAAQILYILLVSATLVAARQVVLEVASVDGLSLAGEGRAEGSVIAVIGILLAIATIIQAVDQLRSARPHRSRTKAVVALSLAILSFFICAAAILIPGNPAILAAALLGASVLLAVFTIRRWLLGPWGTAGLVAVAAIVLFGAFATIPFKKNTDLVTALSTQTQAATERMLSDAGPLGSGAGTFRPLLPIYQDIGAGASQEHPTAAALIAIGMGSAFLWCSIIMVLIGGCMLFNRALSRGHDYIYATAGAGALILLPIVAFADGGLLDLGASLVIGVLCGLALAQSQSGAARAVVSLALQDSSGESDDHQRQALPARSPTFARTWPRFALAIFGFLVSLQAVWILAAERYLPEQNAVATAGAPQEIWKAAAIAKVRGDLWAASGFALVSQPWANPSAQSDQDGIPEPALNNFTRSLRYSPHRGDVWLMLAALGNRYKPAGYDTAALLKMSYYTAPNDLHLLPLRLHVALASDLRDTELRDMIKRDIGLVLSRLPALEPALVAAYRSAPPDRKVVAESLISEVNPRYFKTMRTEHR